MKSKTRRDALVEIHVNEGVAAQIRANRDRRGWSQTELAERAGVAQATISEWEGPDYGRYTLRTLKRLASAFDTSLTVRFAPFSELADWIIHVPEMELSSPGFEEESKVISQSGVAVASTDGASGSAVPLIAPGDSRAFYRTRVRWSVSAPPAPQAEDQRPAVARMEAEAREEAVAA